MNKTILVIGGAGYIGSHTVIKLLQSNYRVLILDNLVNSKKEILHRINQVSQRRVEFIYGDIRDETLLYEIFKKYSISSVMHFAGLKSASESVYKPLDYYEVNVKGTLHLLNAMTKFGVRNLVFSSSATVYGDAVTVPISETFPLNPLSPYGWSKYMVEKVLEDLYTSDSRWNISALRYFNPVGAHESGLIGENPSARPTNLMPLLAQVAIGKLPFLKIFGGDYPTKDGTGIRDYIHVQDLASGHISALESLGLNPGLRFVNLGTGVGYSVIDVIRTFEKVSGVTIPYEIVDRRAGDIAESFSSPELAYDLFGWRATLGLEEMCADVWRWQSMNQHK